MSNPRSACGPVEGFVRPSLVFAVVKVSYIPISYSCFDNLYYDIFEASDLQCHFITSVAVAYRIPKLSVYSFKGNLVCQDQSKPCNVRPSIICHSMCGPGQDSDVVFGSVSHLGWTAALEAEHH